MTSEHHEGGFSGKWYAHPIVRSALIAGILTGAAFGLAHLDVIPSSLEITLYVVAIVLGGYHWSREGIEELFENHEIGIEILMLAAVIGSAILNMWDEAAFLVVLYGLAEGLEEYTYAKTRASIRSLLDLAPKEAHLLRDGTEQRVAAKALQVGQTFIVRPGESIPTDGVIVRGCSNVNEAPVTGESMPVEKREGMKVFAATINQEGVLEVRVTTRFEDNTLSKIIHLVEEAQEQKGKTQVFIERFGRIYSPSVLIIALLLFIVPAVLGIPLQVWARRAVVFLVAAAPCALVMSTPVAIAAGIGLAGRHGVLIKGGAHLETLGVIRAVAFDKTGTLTKGEPVVTDLVPLSGGERELLQLAYGVEQWSEHPLAKAVVARATERGLRAPEATAFSAIAGYGARAMIAGEPVCIGKPELFKHLGDQTALNQRIDALRAEGKTVMLIGSDTVVNGLIAVSDVIRPQARQVIQDLHRLGIKVTMLTGDHAVTATAVAKELGIDEVRADLRPEDKVQAVQALKKTYRFVAMVGDGINDAPALATASLGIAMGVAGTDTAIETADTALMADDLTKLTYALQLGRTARRIGQQNIVGSLLLLAVLIPLALVGVMGVAAAVVLHEGSELLAVVNGLRVAKSKV